MSIDFSGLIEALQRGVGLIPAPGIAILLLGGPTLALIIYRIIHGTRRLPATLSFETAEVPPLWVCQQCLSVNELRLSRCYRCGFERDEVADLYVIDPPIPAPAYFQAPEGSPFTALGSIPAAPPNPDVGAPVEYLTEPIPVEPAHAGSDQAAPGPDGAAKPRKRRAATSRPRLSRKT